MWEWGEQQHFSLCECWEVEFSLASSVYEGSWTGNLWRTSTLIISVLILPGWRDHIFVLQDIYIFCQTHVSKYTLEISENQYKNTRFLSGLKQLYQIKYKLYIPKSNQCKPVMMAKDVPLVLLATLLIFKRFSSSEQVHSWLSIFDSCVRISVYQVVLTLEFTLCCCQVYFLHIHTYKHTHAHTQRNSLSAAVSLLAWL